MNLFNKDDNGNITITNDPLKDNVKLDVSLASYEDLYDAWSKQETTRWYKPENMYKYIQKYNESKK